MTADQREREIHGMLKFMRDWDYIINCQREMHDPRFMPWQNFGIDAGIPNGPAERIGMSKPSADGAGDSAPDVKSPNVQGRGISLPAPIFKDSE